MTDAEIFQYRHATYSIIGKHRTCRKENLTVREYGKAYSRAGVISGEMQNLNKEKTDDRF